jgi:signal transduction histidine kinase
VTGETASSERLLAILDAMADGLAVVDAAGAVREWNKTAEALTGFAAGDVVGRPPPFPLPERAGQPVDHRLDNGRWIEILTAPIGATGERVVDFRDVTEPKNLEEAKDLFLATVSHELRTPITVMRGFAETLLHRWDALADDDRRAAMRVVAERVQLLAALVERLLLGTRAGVGALTLAQAPLDVGSALRDVAASFAHFSDRHRIELDVAPGLPPVLGDRVALDNVVGQLVENAVKYAPDGGVVRISAAGDGEDVRITVEDEGIGIAPEHAERVFERFYQVDTGNRRRFGGVGLGLYIVRELVEAQGGRVTVVPRVDGACLELRLPAFRGTSRDVGRTAGGADGSVPAPAPPAG